MINQNQKCKEVKIKMEQAKSNMPLGVWEKLPTEKIEQKPRITFEVNIPVVATFMSDNPREFQGETGAYYIFDIKVNGEDKVIMTSAWTLLRALKANTPLKNKTFKITKKLSKGKQGFEIEKV